MIQAQDFEFDENLFEFSYNLKINHCNSKINEVISIIKNKSDRYWYVTYTDIYGLTMTIPIEKNEDKDVVINNTCQWFNKIKRQ